MHYGVGRIRAEPPVGRIRGEQPYTNPLDISWIHEISWKFQNFVNFDGKISKPRPKISQNLFAHFEIDTRPNFCEQEIKSYRAVFDISHNLWNFHEISWKFHEIFHEIIDFFMKIHYLVDLNMRERGTRHGSGRPTSRAVHRANMQPAAIDFLNFMKISWISWKFH